MIERCRDAFPVRMMCRCLQVSTSGYYGWRDRPASLRKQSNDRLLTRIRRIHAQSDGVFGSPRMWEELRYLGEPCGRNRVARLMQRDGLRGVPQRRQWRTKSTGTRPEGVRNHLSRDFSADQPNTKWVTDITYIRTFEGWLYLSVVLDLHSGRVVGWSMSARQDTQLVLQSVLMALWQRTGRSPVVLHSDRGCQFTSDEYQRFLRGHQLRSSMSKVRGDADPTHAEKLIEMLGCEFARRRAYRTRAESTGRFALLH